MTIAEFLRTHCRPIDEVDDAAVYRVDKLIEGRFPEYRGFTNLHLLEDDQILPVKTILVDYKTGSLAREFTPKDA